MKNYYWSLNLGSMVLAIKKSWTLKISYINELVSKLVSN